MKPKKIILPLFLSLCLLVLALPVSASATAYYGHISFIENRASVIRADQEECKAVVNLPLVPGDTVVTGVDGRCELQFDNGTVIRLDKESRLRISTILAPTLTSRWKITTLHLLQGQVHARPQTYRGEMFQIITPNAAVKLSSRTAATIRFAADLSTSLYSAAGKFAVLYGADRGSLKEFKVKAGQSYAIDAANTLGIRHEKTGVEFAAWNEYIDRHFKELHNGISKVPPKLKLGNNALRYFAEKWSSHFGEWIYDELFGYVWKPADELFANSAGPFFNADYVRINGQLFLVPQQAWGWVPAHMGTWVWLNTGWTWIPGNWFHPDDGGLKLMNYFCYVFGDFDLYGIYRNAGQKAWQQAFQRTYGREKKEPSLQDLPRPLRDLIKKVEKAPVAVVAEWLRSNRVPAAVETMKMPGTELSPRENVAISTGNRVSRPAQEPLLASKVAAAGLPGKGNAPVKADLKSNTPRDWNPDCRWAAKQGYSILYSSADNAVVCPELNLSSDRVHRIDRSVLAGSAETFRMSVPGDSSAVNGAAAQVQPTATRADASSEQVGKEDDNGKQ